MDYSNDSTIDFELRDRCFISIRERAKNSFFEEENKPRWIKKYQFYFQLLVTEFDRLEINHRFVAVENIYRSKLRFKRFSKLCIPETVQKNIEAATNNRKGTQTPMITSEQVDFLSCFISYQIRFIKTTFPSNGIFLV